MRRAIGPAWPAMTRYFNLHPWDVERLTYRELRFYREALNAILAGSRGRPAPLAAPPPVDQATGELLDGQTIPVVRI